MPIDLTAVRWIHGVPDGATPTDPPIQVLAYDDDTYILRQSMSVDFEAPFIYLLLVARPSSSTTRAPRNRPTCFRSVEPLTS
jgi:hypothetical protein